MTRIDDKFATLRAEGRKAFVAADLRDPDGNVLAEANGLMIRLLPGQP